MIDPILRPAALIQLGDFTDSSVGESPSERRSALMRFATNIGESPQPVLLQTVTGQLKISAVTRESATIVHHSDWRIG